MPKHSAGTLVVFVMAPLLAAPQDAEKPKSKLVIGTMEKCTPEKGMIAVKVKKNEGDQGMVMDYQVTDDTQFVVNNGKGEKSTIFKGKKEFAKDRFKDKFKAGVTVGVWLSEDGKVAKRVITDGRRKAKKDQQ